MPCRSPISHLADALDDRGRDAIAVTNHAFRGSGDEIAPLRAAEEGRLLITHNGKDFKLLHRAWLSRPLPLAHAGIFVVSQKYELSIPIIVELLAGLARDGRQTQNRLFDFQQHPLGGLSYVWEAWNPRGA